MEPVSAPTPAARARRRPGPLARLDRIPVWPYEKRLLWVVGAGYFFAFFDIVTISFALPVIATQFHASKGAVSLSVTSSLIGYIIGALADSQVADKWGRKLSLAVSVTLFSVGTALAAVSWNVTSLVVFRFISGLGIGAEIAAVTTYLSEISPAPLRGRYTSWATTCRLRGFRRRPLRGPLPGAQFRRRLAHPVRDRRAGRPHHPVHAAGPARLAPLAGLAGARRRGRPRSSPRPRRPPARTSTPTRSCPRPSRCPTRRRPRPFRSRRSAATDEGAACSCSSRSGSSTTSATTGGSPWPPRCSPTRATASPTASPT